MLFVGTDVCDELADAIDNNLSGIHNLGLGSLIILADEGQTDFASEWAQKFKCFFITEPLVIEELAILMERALDTVLLKDQLDRYEYSGGSAERFGSVIAKSEEMKEIIRVAKILATREDPLLFCGSVGTGKELIAKTIHEHSARRHGPFYSINCKSFSNEDLLVELFGKEDSDSHEQSLLELCSEGTLFMDEISEIPPTLQGKLQRYLEDKTYTKVNSRKVYSSDVRICAGTSEPLNEKVMKGEFSEEMYFYLNRFTLHIPSLRRRLEDIPVLVEEMLKETAKAKGLNKLSITEDALKLLVEYNWPGNVRELKNSLEYAALVAEEKPIESRHLPKQFHDEVGSIFVGTNPDELPPLEEIERQYILRVMDACRGNKVRAANILEVNRATLHRKLQMYETQKQKKII
jgi:DNA-binding NtrC family response regulator